MVLRSLSTIRTYLATRWLYHTHTDKMVLRTLEDREILLTNMKMLLDVWPATNQAQQIPQLEEPSPTTGTPPQWMGAPGV